MIKKSSANEIDIGKCLKIVIGKCLKIDIEKCLKIVIGGKLGLFVSGHRQRDPCRWIPQVEERASYDQKENKIKSPFERLFL